MKVGASVTVPLLAQALAVAALASLVYWVGLGGGFLFDDYPNIVNNTRLHVTSLDWEAWLGAALSSPAADLPRPLAMLTFAANHYFSGLDPWPMKLTNVGIHAFNCALVVLLCTRIIGFFPRPVAARQAWLPILVGAAWALHPINLSAVLLVVQRMEVLSHSFVLLGLLSYMAGRQAQIAGRNGWGHIIGGMLGCTIIGVMSKESAALTPLYAFILEWALLQFRAADENVHRQLKAFFLVVIVVPAAAGLFWIAPRSLGDGAYAGREFTLTERVLTEARVVITYARWIAVPDLGELSLNHDDLVVSRGLFRPATTAFAIAMIFALLAVAVWLRRRRPEFTLGMLWFGAAHLLTATVIPLELMFEHRNYFASLGLLLAFFGLLTSSGNGQRVRIGLVLGALLTAFFASSTLLRALEWGDPVRLSRSEALKRPLSPRATYDWGRTLVIASAYDPHSRHTQEAFAALERARLVPGSTILPNHALIILANRTGVPVDPQWWEDMIDKLGRQPVGPEQKAALAALSDCANLGLCGFQKSTMMRVFNAALARGDDAEILNIYASYAWSQWRDAEFSRAMWTRSIELNPAEPQYRINLGKLLIAVGREAEARRQIEALRRLGRLGQYEGAAADLERRLSSGALEAGRPDYSPK